MVFKLTSLAFLASIILSASAAPIEDSSTATLVQRDGGSPGHPYQCAGNYSEAAHKQSLISMGATPRDLAITILETSCHMDGQSYVYGDVLPDGTQKTKDSANFGLFKNNWHEIRTHCAGFTQYGPDDWTQGNALNIDPKAAIVCQHQQMAGRSPLEFYKAQRGVGDGTDYQAAIEYIEGYIKDHLNDDMVTYYNLGAV